MAGLTSGRAGIAALNRPAIGIVLVMLLMMVGAGFAGVRIFDSVEQLHDSASRASEEAAAADEVLDALQDSETAERGYLLTRRPAYLEPYLANRSRMEQGLHRLEMLIDASPWLRDEVGPLRAAAEARMAEIDKTLAVDGTAGANAALAVILTEEGRRAMESARRYSARIQQHAIAEREDRTMLLVARERETLYIVIAAALLGTLLLGCAALGLLVSRTRLVWAQTALSNQSGRLQATVEHIRDGLAVFDTTDRLILWNTSFFPIAGLPATLGEPGTPFARFAAPATGWDPPLLASARAEPEAGETTSAEIRAGEKVLEVWRGGMPDGGHILAVTDITRRSRAEAIARQAQKMEALGQLTGGVAHDFNNLLQVIAANLELIDTRLPPGAPDSDWLRARIAGARSGVERGARLVRHLLAFARRQPLAPQPTDPGGLMRGMEEMLCGALGAKVPMRLAIPDGVWAVRVDPQQLENAVLNLAINGRDAMDGGAGGRPAMLEIRLANATLDPAAAAQCGVQAGDYVCLSVTDTGAGMSEATVARAVEPFFSTKSESQGTGLGLPMVYGFARQSGGALKIDSAPGRGTTVSLLLPRTDETPASAAMDGGSNMAADKPVPRQRILVAEDDQPVRATTTELLRGLGHDVVQAGSAAEALCLLDGQTTVLMADLGLPDMDGRDLANQAMAANPGLAVIIASGKAPEAGEDDPRIVWLDKPYSAGRLAVAMSRATAGRGQGGFRRPA